MIKFSSVECGCQLVLSPSLSSQFCSTQTLINSRKILWSSCQSNLTMHFNKHCINFFCIIGKFLSIKIKLFRIQLVHVLKTFHSTEIWGEREHVVWSRHVNQAICCESKKNFFDITCEHSPSSSREESSQSRLQTERKLILLFSHCFQESCLEFERLVSAQCESLIQMIHERREFLIDTIRMDKETKLRTLKVRRHNLNFIHP